MLEIYMGNLKDLLSARQSLKSYEASAKWLVTKVLSLKELKNF